MERNTEESDITAGRADLGDTEDFPELGARPGAGIRKHVTVTPAQKTRTGRLIKNSQEIL